MAEKTIASGETVTVAAGETYEAGPLNLDGTLVLDGTADIGEHSLTATADAGLTATGRLTSEPGGPISASAGLGLSTAATPSKAKALLATADAGATATATPSGEKDMIGTAELGIVTGTGLGVGGLGQAPLGGSERVIHGEKDITATAEMGALAEAIIESFRPLIRSNSVGIDNSRRTEFDTQGTGETDD